MLAFIRGLFLLQFQLFVFSLGRVSEQPRQVFCVLFDFYYIFVFLLLLLDISWGKRSGIFSIAV